MEQIDRAFMEDAFGTLPDIEDINNAIEVLKEWKAELEELENDENN